MANKPSILFVIGDLDVGGAERHLALIAPGLARQGYRASIYTLTHRGKMAPELEAAGVRVIEPPFGTLLADGPRWLRRICLLPLTALGMLMELLRRPNMVHFFLPMPYLVGGLLALISGTRVRIMSRRSLGHYQRGHPQLARVERWLHPKMTAILGNAKAVTAELLDEGVPPERLGLIYNGIDTTPFDGLADKQILRLQLGINEDAVVLALVANLIPYKGHADLIEALAEVKSRMPKNWVLLCVGEEKRETRGTLDKLSVMADNAGLSQHIQWLGLRDDVPSILAAADVGLMCSHQEGFSNSVLEAMAAGLAMVVTDVGGNPEAVIDGETGLVVAPQSPDELGTALVNLAGDADLRSQMGRAARQRLEDNFTLDACLQNYDRFYSGLLGETKPSPKGSMRTAVLWRAKVAAKIILSRLPLGYGFWKRFSLFEHGSMDDPSYAFGVFETHFERCRQHLPKDSYTCLELGPGDSLMMALLGRAFGAREVIMVDVGNFAAIGMTPYRRMATFLRDRGLDAPEDSEISTIETMLRACNARYLTDGLQSLKAIESESVDFIFSQAVLEHVRKTNFAASVAEHRRILREGGICSHRVDLRDHLGGALNNLRYSETTWESDFMANSGFYTNRIGFSPMLKQFSDAGFKVEVLKTDRWDALPTPRPALAKPFAQLPDDELRVHGFDVILYPM